MGPYPRPDKAERKTDEAVDRIRSDATAVETTARLLDNVPSLPRGQQAKVVETLYAFAAGMRAAADMVSDSLEIPF